MKNNVILTPKMKEALVCLARRKKPSCLGWFRATFSGKYNNYVSLFCEICDEQLSGDLRAKDRHGLQHLKEHGLLIFI